MHTETLRGIYWYCADYHDGQWSREYRIMCRIGGRLKARQIHDPMQFPLSEHGVRIYERLVAKYESKRR